MSTFDLNAYRAAKIDADPEKVVTVGKKEYNLPPSLPLASLELFAEGKIKAGLAALGGDKFADALYSDNLTADELSALLTEVYGTALGN